MSGASETAELLFGDAGCFRGRPNSGVVQPLNRVDTRQNFVIAVHYRRRAPVNRQHRSTEYGAYRRPICYLGCAYDDFSDKRSSDQLGFQRRAHLMRLILVGNGSATGRKSPINVVGGRLTAHAQISGPDGF